MKVRCTEEGPVWRLELSPSGAGMALSAEGIVELRARLSAAEQSPSARVLVLQSAGEEFCRGMNLDEVSANAERYVEQGIADYADLLKALRDSSRVLVALVDGAALAGGVGIAAACDLVLASDQASFGLPEVVIGLVPAMVLPLLAERMPIQRARRFALSGLAVDAQQALELGLVDALAPAKAGETSTEALERALRKALRQLLRTEPGAVGALKEHCRQIGAMACEAGIDAGAERTAGLLGQDDRVSAIQAFLEGEPLPWFDRYRKGR